MENDDSENTLVPMRGCVLHTASGCGHIVAHGLNLARWPLTSDVDGSLEIVRSELVSTNAVV